MSAGGETTSAVPAAEADGRLPGGSASGASSASSASFASSGSAAAGPAGAAGRHEHSGEGRAWRRRIALVAAPLLMAAAALYGLTTGAVGIPARELYAALAGSGDSAYEQILWNLRIPRVAIGALVGMCLAIAGCLLQGVMRNPLADPGLIGVSSGAGLAAIVIMIIFPQLMPLVPLAAFAGAIGAVFVTYSLAWKGGASAMRLVLSGVAINALIGAVTSAIMLLYSERVQAVLPWLIGGLGGRSWKHLEMMLPYAIVGLALAAFAIKPANVMLLGDDTAKLLGHPVEASRLFLVAVATLLAGTAVSVAGLLGFVGLVVPHIARMIVGTNYAYFLPVSAFGGAFLTVLADTAARSWFDPIELPVGILLAFLGAPFFLYLLRKGGIRSGQPA
ncbi:iron chelate uptake ABC transporter family permease subunit [Paenibacillus ginsengihumi]|uniref:FecCD family ABC transporter permease n=1 Tax=Paenibacillus ginsengihumi TaxID=431596 RepID=UPI000375AB6D